MSNNNEIFMTENKSNKASIIVAILAICLILGGVYLLNQSFTSSNKTQETAKTSNTSPKTETTSSKATPTTSSTPTSNSQTSTATPTTTNTATPTTSTTTSSGTTNSGTSTTPTTTPAATPTPAAKPTLTENQLIAKALSVSSSGEVKFEIQECGLPNAKVCKAGTKFSLTGVKATADKVYLVSGNISESNGTLSLENITIKENT